MASDIPVIQSVTLTLDEILDRAEASFDAIREIAGETVNANSVEVRLWTAALLMASMDNVVVGKDPIQLVQDRLAMFRAAEARDRSRCDR